MFASRFLSSVAMYWQCLLWLLLQPSLWRQHIEQIEPGLKADFAWRDLHGKMWTNAKLQALFTRLHFIAPLVIGIISAIFCYFLFDAHHAIRAFVYTTTLTFVSALLSAILVSVAFALISSSLAGGLLGLGFGLDDFSPDAWYIFAVSACGFALAAASQTLITLANWTEKPQAISPSLLKIGLLLNVSFVIVLVLLALWLPDITYKTIQPWFDGIEKITLYSTIYVSYLSLLIFILLGNFLNRWGLALIIAMVFGLIISGFMASDIPNATLDFTVSNLLMRPLIGSISNSLFFTLLFSIPYLMLRLMFRNIYAGIFAGLLFSLGVYIFVFFQEAAYHLTLLLGIISAVSLGFLLMFRHDVRHSRQVTILLFKWIHWLLASDASNKKIEQKDMNKLNWLQILVNWFHGLSQTYKQYQTETKRNINDSLQDGIKIRNYYSPSPIVSNRENQLFVGRENTIKRIQSYLEAENHVPMLLWGQRRIGKTSLVHQLKTRLPDRFQAFYVDMQTIVSMAKNEADFFFVFARKLYLAAPDVLVQPQRQDFYNNPAIVFDEYLENIEQAYQGKRIQLIFDEFESLEKAFKEGILEQDRFLSYLRHLLQHRHQLSILLVGFHFVSELPSWAQYFTSVVDINLSYLDDAAVQRLLQPDFVDFPLRYEDEAYMYLRQVTHNHPMMLQVLCWQLVNCVNERRHHYANLNRALICKADIEAAIDAGKYFHAFADMLNVSSTLDAFLIPLAKKGVGYAMPEQEVLEDISNELLQSLYREGTIEKDSAGKVSFTLEPIRRVFAAKSLTD